MRQVVESWQQVRLHTCADPESFARGGPTLTTGFFPFLFDKGREDTNSSKRRPSSARRETPFKWHFAGGPMMAQH